MTTTTLESLLNTLDADLPRRTMLEKYAAGAQPLAFLAPEARRELNGRLDRMAINLPRLAVNAIVERLRIRSVAGDQAEQLWADWTRCDLDQLAPVAHREALTLGSAYAIVWTDAQGRPQTTIESPLQVAVLRDPATRAVTAAVKRYMVGQDTHAMLFEPDRVTHCRSRQAGNPTTGFEVIETLDNWMGVVPVVPIENTERLIGAPTSEIDDLVPLVDAANKLTMDMMTASEFVGRPRRYATGVAMIETPVLDAQGRPTGDVIEANPYPETGGRMMISENPDSRFGSLPAGDLAGYEAAMRVILGQISAISGLPANAVGLFGDQPSSADAIRASEAGLVAKVESRQRTFGRAWEQVGRLMLAVRTGQEPSAFEVAVQWGDPATRSMAQEADATVKLFGAGLLPASYALAKLGYSDDEIRKIETARTSTPLAG